jgi:hypothetical protein
LKDTISLEQSASYPASKHHLLPSTRLADALQIAKDILALHATSATTPYLSLWARMTNFDRGMLDEALYEERSLSRVLCMRSTVHIVPSDGAAMFIRGFGHLSERRTPPQFQRGRLLVQAGICSENEAERTYKELTERIVHVLRERGPSTTKELAESVPELKARIRHDVGKKYEGDFSIGSRLVNALAARGVIIRTRPLGSWRSSLYEYAALDNWLPSAQLDRVTVEESHQKIIRQYLAAFGPTSIEDILWWTGLTQAETAEALAPIQSRLVQVRVQDTGQDLMVLEDDLTTLRDFRPPAEPSVFLLPSLDPFIMGYRDRQRFLSPEHADKVFDRSGNALPTVWAGGRIVGGWGQRRDGKVVIGLFEHVSEDQLAAVARETERLQNFIGDEFIKPAFFHTHFTRALESQ